ncbi:MAG: hypothetical protein K5765_08000, partial [Clostridia bacterium]|nr:hypothetical protein [Clostridia bacterium]
MKKERSLQISILILLSLVLIGLFLFSNSYFKVNALDLGTVDIESISEDVEKVYDGEVVNIRVTLNKEVDSIDYEWYRGNAPSAVMRLYLSEENKTEIVCPIKDVESSGYYRCKITKITSGSSSLDANIESDVIKVTINPKEVEVKTPKYEFTYTSDWITPDFTIKEEDLCHGDAVPSVNIDSDFPLIETGDYEITTSFDNSNYVPKATGNNALTGSNFSIKINPAELKIAVKEKIITEKIAQDKGYELEIEYIGFLGNDDESYLDFTPTIPSTFNRYKEAGVYTVYVESNRESYGHYTISYPRTKLYINLASCNLNDSSGEGIGTIVGSVKADTNVYISETQNIKLMFYEIRNKEYTLNVTSGGLDSNGYTINIENVSLVNFFLSVRMYDKDNNRIEINNFTYNKADQTLSIQASGKFEGTIVVYNNILYIIIIGG